MKKRNIFLSFWAFVVYALVIFAVLTFVLMGRLNTYLEEYEYYQPTTLSDSVLELFSQKDAEALSALNNPGDKLEGEVFEAYLDRFVNPGTLFCYKASSFDDKLIYDYISDNRKLASLTLALTGEKSPQGFDIYEIDSLVWYPLMRYSITAPEDCTVYINGTDISKTKAQAIAASRDTSYEDFDGYVFSTVKYTIEHLEYITDIKASGDGQAEIIIEKTESEDGLTVDYTVSRKIPEDMVSQLDVQARDAVKAYIYYTTLHSIPVSTVLPYIHKDAALYSYVQRFDNTWSNSKVSDEFPKFEVSDFVYYTDKRASCRTSVIYRLHKYSFSRDYDFDFKLFFIKDNEKWYLTSMERVVEEK